MDKSKVCKKQVKTIKKMCNPGRGGVDKLFKVKIRYDDQCGNGHNTFSITGEFDCLSGMIHDKIEEHFPELQHLLKWHLCSSAGPLQYIANTTYHASDKDFRGLRKDETKQLLAGGITPVWKLSYNVNGSFVDADIKGIDKIIRSHNKPELDLPGLSYEPWLVVGEGKQPDLEAARATAIWPDATIEQLQNVDILKARLPGLLEEFKVVIESLGFTW